jgi:hypothetical protein
VDVSDPLAFDVGRLALMRQFGTADFNVEVRRAD